MVKKYYFRKNLLFVEFLVFFVAAFIIAQNVTAVNWPNEDDWILIYTDPTPDSSCEHRDVNATYYYFSGKYMYLRMDTLATPTFGGSGSCKDSLYKWFLDFNGDAYVSGSSNIIHNYEYLIIAYNNKSYLCDSNALKIGQCVQITNKSIEDFYITGSSLYMAIKLSYINTSTVKSVYWTVEGSTQNLNQRPSGNSVDWSDFGGGNVTQPFIPIPHVTITKTSDKITVVNGETVKFTLNIYNDGQAVLHNVTVVDVLPTGLTFSGSASPAPNNSTNGKLTWSLGEIVNGTSKVITFNATVGIQSGTLVNYANVTGIGIENKSVVSDEDTVTLTVIEPALYLDKTAFPSPAVQGNSIVYTIQISNDASTGAYNVTVIDALPNEVIYNSASCADASISYNSSTNTVTLFFNLIGASTGYSCTIDVTLKNNTGNTTITNYVNLTYVNSNGILQTPLYDSVSTYIQYCANGDLRECGDLNCKGTQTCYDGFWGNCTSMGKDCGVCCMCSNDTNHPESYYDETQDNDCSNYTLPMIATCNNDPDNNPYTWDYFPGFISECNGKFSCTSGSYIYTHTCNKSECNAECDAVNPCLDKCEGTNYYKSNGCQADCTCSYSITDCSQLNGWYNTTNTRTYTLGPCGDIEQREQEYRQYNCNTTKPGCDNYTVLGTRWINISGINYYPSLYVCRLAQGVCDVAEYCNGSSVECPDDLKSTALCRPSAGNCDIEEHCDGKSNDCPADQFRPNTFECRPSHGPCDVAEYCTGASAYCPEDAFKPSGEVCRPAGYYYEEQCDVQETCNGTSAKCPSDEYKLDGTPCDDDLFCKVGETCQSGICVTGNDRDCSSNDIPPVSTCFYNPDNYDLTYDYFEGFTSVCDEANDRCTTGVENVISTCDIERCHAECVSTSDCPTGYYCDNCLCKQIGNCVTDADCAYMNNSCSYGICNVSKNFTCEQIIKPSGTLCRESAGICDTAEYCDGKNAVCPNDVKSTAECRPSAGVCDIAEYCDGQSNDCPADQFRPNNYMCRPSTGSCDVAEYCTGASASCPEDESGPNLFLSEYVEGSSNNKALEIYNPKDTAINLSGYKIEIYYNGATTPYTTIILPSYNLSSKGVYVICHTSFTQPSLCNQLHGSINFNGDDALILKNPAGAILDVIGQVGVDPGTEWGSGNTSTQNNTLVRKCDITCGDMNPNDAFDPALEWYGYAINTFSYLGYHSTICCGNGQFDSGEQCESPFDICCDNLTCKFKSSDTVCRPAVDDCDVDDYCTGESASCTAIDDKAPQGTLCGSERLCPSSYCDGFIAKFYPPNGHDTCDGQGNCVEYSCNMLNSYCTDDDKSDGVNTLECGAECDQDSDCEETNCDSYDKCYDGTYRDYINVPNTCMNTCYCTKIGCSDYNEVITDYDKDGYDIECDNDCNDTDWSIYPGAKEICNGLDDDCDGVVDNITETCGTGNCTGTRTCINGTWSDCSTKGKDIGICAICDSQGNPTYDETQDSDCSALLCPESGCGAGNCGEHIFGSYPEKVENYCQDIYTCTQNICNVECEADNDKDNWSISCGDCNDNNPNINPSVEEQCNNIDDNCNNITDENLISSRQCGVSDVGICKLGYEFSYCIDGNYTAYQDCTAVFPKTEICDNGLDDDCDGKVDEGCGTGGGGGGINPPKVICNDGIQNNGEEGIDCGGPCPPCPVTPVEETTTTIPEITTTTTTTTTVTPTTTQTTTTFPIATTTTIVAPGIIGAAINAIGGAGGALLFFLALLAFILFLWWRSRKYVATPSFLNSLDSEELKRLVEGKKTLYVTESVLAKDTRLKEFVEKGKVKVAELKKDKKLDELLEILKVKLDQETAEAVALAIQMKAKLFAKNKTEVNLALKRGLKVYTKF